MTKKTLDIIVFIAEVVFEVVVFIKDKLTGGKNDNRSGNSAEAQQ